MGWFLMTEGEPSGRPTAQRRQAAGRGFQRRSLTFSVRLGHNRSHKATCYSTSRLIVTAV